MSLNPREKCNCLGYPFFIYCQTLIRVLSACVLCTLRVAGWKPTCNHIEIVVGFFSLYMGWLSLYRGHPLNVPILRTMHLSSVSRANDTRECPVLTPNFSSIGGEIEPGNSSTRGKCLTTELPGVLPFIFKLKYLYELIKMYFPHA